jgi:hypothetical protein
MRQTANDDPELQRLKQISDLSAIRLRIAAQRLRDHIRFDMRYNPDWQSEPRIPLGETGGGRWANLGAVAAQRIRARQSPHINLETGGKNHHINLGE